MKNLYIGEDNLLQVVDPENADDGTDLVSATVTFDIKDTAGAVIKSGITSTWVNANAENKPAYQGTFAAADSAALVEGTQYVVWVNINSLQGYRKVVCVAKYHGAE